MKPIRIVLTPTRSRPLNIFLGLVLLLVSLLLLLALATYHPSDPSLNTATAQAAHNWIGLFGAWLSDLLLQALGFTAFFIPLWLAGIGWTWMQSRHGGSALLRWVGTLLALVFVPAVFALLPWHWRWLHVLPVEGIMGRLMAGLLVRYLNIQGAWLVAGVLAATGLYFASAVSIWALKDGLQDRWILFQSWHDRWRDWRDQRAEMREERRAWRETQRHAVNPDAKEAVRRPSFFATLFRRHQPVLDPELLDEIPAFQRAALKLGEDEVPLRAAARRPSIWERADAVFGAASNQGDHETQEAAFAAHGGSGPPSRMGWQPHPSVLEGRGPNCGTWRRFPSTPGHSAG